MLEKKSRIILWCLMNPKVSVIMPTIRDKYLGKAIQSIFNQTLEDWELIIFNNNPNRKLEYKDSRIKVYDTNNLDLSTCFNRGTEYAKSNIIMHHSVVEHIAQEHADHVALVKAGTAGLDVVIHGSASCSRLTCSR